MDKQKIFDFLDYQENRQLATTRWTDRVVSSSGDWSGNLFDYVFKVLPKLTADLTVKLTGRLSDKVTLAAKVADKLTDILIVGQQKEYITSSDVETLTDVSERTARRYLNLLADAGFLKSEGGNKNKKYRYIG